MSLRTCLFTRKVFYTDGTSVGTIRVEFIPDVLPRQRQGKTQPIRRRELAQTQTIPIDLSGDDSVGESDVSCSSTEEL